VSVALDGAVAAAGDDPDEQLTAYTLWTKQCVLSDDKAKAVNARLLKDVIPIHTAVGYDEEAITEEIHPVWACAVRLKVRQIKRPTIKTESSNTAFFPASTSLAPGRIANDPVPPIQSAAACLPPINLAPHIMPPDPTDLLNYAASQGASDIAVPAGSPK
jgi:hypothetical protein